MEETLKNIAASLERIEERLAEILLAVSTQGTPTFTFHGPDLNSVTAHVAKEFNRALDRASFSAGSGVPIPPTRPMPPSLGGSN